MQRTCPISGQTFTIFPDDLKVYEKMDVPPPTLCPLLRLVRRMTFRNEQSLYNRTCDITGQKIVSNFAPNSPHKVCEKNYWYSNKFDGLNYGRDFDFSRPFFEQFHEFLLDIPLPSLRVEQSENCEYNSDMSKSKDCYLCARTHQCSGMLYTYRGNRSHDCTDCRQVLENSQFLYECVECLTCYDSQFLEFCERCNQSSYLSHCRNCSDCFLCAGLNQKQYCFLNQQLKKEEYEAKLASFDLGSRAVREDLLQQFERLKKENPGPENVILKSEDCSGQNIFNSKNCFQCYDIKNVQDGRYLFNVMRHNDAMDCYSGTDGELVYENTATPRGYNVKFSFRASDCRDTEYSMFLNHCENMFGCIGLRREKYCILNKKYSEEDYLALREKIINHMKETKEWGEYFPIALSPFAYNETVAQEYYPITKEFALSQGWRWQDDDPKDFLPSSVEIPDNITDTDDSICDVILACQKTGKNYKIVPQELKFYKKYCIPSPVFCPEVRHQRRFELQKIPTFSS